MWFVKKRRAQSIEDYETWQEGGTCPTLNVMDNNGDTRATVLIFYGNRVDDIRMQGDVINTLQARMGTGGNNMPLVAYPIQDGRDMEKQQNGLGIGEEGDPSYTLDRTGGQAVAYPIQGTIIGRSDTAGPQGKGFGDSTDPMYTIDTVGGNAVAQVGNFELYDFPKEEVSPSLNARRAKDTLMYAYDEFNDSVSDTHHTLRSGTKQSTGVVSDSIVRRLTPRECERLQGFPDDWTASQSDSQRYKQMGNAVAVPVVEWIVNRLVEVNNAGSNAKSEG